MIEHPFQLRARKVGVDDEAGQFLDALVVAGFDQFPAVFRGAPVLPDDGVAERFSRFAIPQHCGLSLVGDSDTSDFYGGEAGFLDGFTSDIQLRFPDFGRVVLYPAGVGKELFELLLGDRDDFTLLVEDNRA